MKKGRFASMWSITYALGHVLMLLLSFTMVGFSEPQLLLTLTFPSMTLAEGFATTASIVSLGQAYGLQFDEPNQTLTTPVLEAQHGMRIQFTWLAFLMTDHPVNGSDVFAIGINGASVALSPADMHITTSCEVYVEGPVEGSIQIQWKSPWSEHASRLLPVLKRLEVYDGSTVTPVS